MNLFTSKSKYNLGLTKEPVEQPLDLMSIYEKVKKKKQIDNENKENQEKK